MNRNLPYLTSFAGVGGAIKLRAEDFFVQELPLYEPSGEGEHLFVEIQKVGLTTFDAINRISRALSVSSRDIGYAGLKDARAITRQTLSISGIDESGVMPLQIPGITILRAARHGNKLRLGHLRGNRFAIRIREVNPTDVVKLREPLAELQRRGLPNYFGEQRFGRRGNNDQLGAALIGDRPERVLRLLLGSPDPEVDDEPSLRARQLFEEGNLEPALQAFPQRDRLERSILSRLMRTGSAEAAVRAIDEKLRRLWISALQSRLFNEVVAARIDALDRVLPGDLAYKHGHGAVFRVEDAGAEQARCEAFEISPSGPLVGYRLTLPSGEPLRIEQAVFQAHGLEPASFRQDGRERARGERRPLRVRPEDIQLAAGVDEHGGHITVAFSLPAGSYATVLMSELMKSNGESNGGAHPRPAGLDE